MLQRALAATFVILFPKSVFRSALVTKPELPSIAPLPGANHGRPRSNDEMLPMVAQRKIYGRESLDCLEVSPSAWCDCGSGEQFSNVERVVQFLFVLLVNLRSLTVDT